MSEWLKHLESTSKNRNIFKQCVGNRRLIELIIEYTPKNGRILEAGCGTAILSLILADYGFKVTALDFDEEVINYAEKRVRLNSAELNFTQGDILKLSSSFKNAYFDTVCHSGVMEHFTDNDIIKGLSEQRMVSKRLIFNIPNSRNKIKRFGDERYLSNKKWLTLIKEAGFSKVKVFGASDLPILTNMLPSFFFHRRTSFWWKYLSKHSIFVCE